MQLWHCGLRPTREVKEIHWRAAAFGTRAPNKQQPVSLVRFFRCDYSFPAPSRQPRNSLAINVQCSLDFLWYSSSLCDSPVIHCFAPSPFFVSWIYKYSQLLPSLHAPSFPLSSLKVRAALPVFNSRVFVRLTSPFTSQNPLSKSTTHLLLLSSAFFLTTPHPLNSSPPPTSLLHCFATLQNYHCANNSITYKLHKKWLNQSLPRRCGWHPTIAPPSKSVRDSESRLGWAMLVVRMSD